MEALPLFRAGRLIVALKPRLIDAIGVAALKFADDNFAAQAFQGATTQPWPKRKKQDKGGRNRKILVQTGALRRSLKKTDSPSGTTISTDIPYAKIHNEGEDIQHKTRSVILSYTRAKGGKLKLGKTQTEAQQRRIRELRRATVQAHTTNMPRRQFIGNSPVLTADIETTLINIIAQALTTV